MEAAPTSTMPSSTPEFCTPESEVDWPGVSPKTMPGEGLEDQVLRAVGQHGDEDEDGEAAGRGIRPHLGDGLGEGDLGLGGCVLQPLALPFDAPQGGKRQQEGRRRR